MDSLKMFISDSELMRLLLALGYAIVAGIFYSLLGYFKRHDSSEVFNGEQFLVSLVVGVIAGFLAFHLNISSEQALTLVLAEAGLLSFIEDGVKAIWRRWIQPWLQKTATPPKS